MSSTLTSLQVRRSQAAPVWLCSLNCWSLDAPLVAGCWSACLIQAVTDGPSPSVWLSQFVLLLVVWLIYAADRLWDGRRVDVGRAVTERHRFARRCAAWLWRTWYAVAGLAVGLIAFGVPRPVCWAGWGLAMPVIAYLAVVHLRPDWPIPKEAIVGGLFAAGCALPAFAVAIPERLLCPVILLAALSVLNCLLVAWGQLESDRQQRFPSLMRRTGRWTPYLPACGLLLSVIAVACWGWAALPAGLTLASLFAGAGLGYLALRMQRSAAEQRAALCLWADVALGVPAAAVWLWGEVWLS